MEKKSDYWVKKIFGKGRATDPCCLCLQLPTPLGNLLSRHVNPRWNVTVGELNVNVSLEMAHVGYKAFLLYFFYYYLMFHGPWWSGNQWKEKLLFLKNVWNRWTNVKLWRKYYFSMKKEDLASIFAVWSLYSADLLHVLTRHHNEDYAETLSLSLKVCL